MSDTEARADNLEVGDDWWPDLLRYMGNEDPWASPDIVVAELRAYDDPGYPGIRMLWSALVSTAQLEAMGNRLIGFNYDVETSGPHPWASQAGDYRPWFRISALDGERRIECEPLVLSWESNNTTAMVIDPGFTMTYGLIPRGHADGSISWDNVEEPEHDVARVDAPSTYNDGFHSGAKVVIARDYLQDYLTLRGLELVQVYYESRRGRRDDAIAKVLDGKTQRDLKLADRLLDVRLNDAGDGYFVQTWGARRIAGPAGLPISTDPLEKEGLIWPGLDGPVTATVARGFRPGDYVYVRDTVLGAYEGQPGFRVSSESGGVSFGNQWSVGYTDRIGRDAIRVEIKKLYEGTRSRVIQHWHDHAIAPSPYLTDSTVRSAKNVGTRAKALVYAVTALGERLASLADKLNILDVTGVDVIGLDRAQLDYEGWWSGPHVEQITRHIPLNLDKSGFLNRCLALDKVAVEALQQKYLRRMVRAIGVPTDKIDDFRGLKLLDRLICLSLVAEDAGLPLWESGDEIIRRFQADDAKSAMPIAKLFALSNLRQAAGHRKSNEDEIIGKALERFGLDRSAAAGGWGAVLDQIYDQVAEQVEEAEQILAKAMAV